MGRSNRPWSADDDATLLAVQNDGISLQRIAVRLGRTNRAVKARLALLRRRAIADNEPRLTADYDGPRRNAGA
jgi:hypothetical protein